MKATLDIPWYQYALIVELAEKMQLKGHWLGKTALQKFIYLLEMVYNVPCGYFFTLYIHGPFCSDIMNDLDYVSALNGVKVEYDYNMNGYRITPGSSGKEIKNKAQDFLSVNEQHIEKMLQDFGLLRTRDLELRSTIVFIDRDAKISGREFDRNEFIQEIKGIKPHFSRQEIEFALDELESKGYVEKRD